MNTQKHRPDAESPRDAYTLDALKEACERFVDVSRKPDDLRGKLIERGSRYERAYHSEHRKLLLITAAQKTLIAENEQLKYEIEYLRQSALPRN